MTTTLHRLLCTVCGGEFREDIITHEERREDKLYIFHNVPARVCNACGKLWIDEEVLQAIDHLIEAGVPIRKIEVPVFDFGHTPPCTLQDVEHQTMERKTMAVVRIDKRRRVTIPKEFCEELGLGIEDYIEVTRIGGVIVLRPKLKRDLTIDDLEAEVIKGIESGPGTPVTEEGWQKIREEVRRRSKKS